jgi:hypothetical protein
MLKGDRFGRRKICCGFFGGSFVVFWEFSGLFIARGVVRRRNKFGGD